MPIYAFRCRSCGFQFEEFVRRVGAKAPCPKCGRKDVERQVTAPAAHRGSAGGLGCSIPPGSGGV
jgi:putative FmdB family regulatory protein